MGEALDAVGERLRDHGDDRLVMTDERRLRSLLVRLGAEFGASGRDGVAQAAVMVELLHRASAADAHRGDVLRPDRLLARSAQLAAGLGTSVLQLHAQTAGRLAAGQMRELAGPAPGEDPVARYFEVAAGRTAALFALSLGSGALQAATPDRCVRALTDYGEHLGVALRIAEDLLATTAPAARTGHAPGKDPFDGAPGLPVLLARADTSARGAELRGLLTGDMPDEAARRRALELLRTAPATRRAEAALSGRLAAAVAALGVLPPLPARTTLHALCDLVAVGNRPDHMRSWP
ncbi:polyprenyl synthetase family protein [Streptomyces sp. NL15-2K]|uniref:polyprenyl synthetase family protein n=1 Tax=Streptomyces sp. NL15-2K TaxID=376149 RepID=UPI000F574E87|nr:MULTISPECIES: polyprenyl synthetase family protein [Actinomycetes]WKX12769.1 polyprenyl synthetase family protein [Kutzneria buriramensis]GCB51415.1 octaprenyl diphosphate synthase [Streptomyces sp. NL15-2K]